jgi:hypothetical protein
MSGSGVGVADCFAGGDGVSEIARNCVRFRYARLRPDQRTRRRSERPGTCVAAGALIESQEDQREGGPRWGVRDTSTNQAQPEAAGLAAAQTAPAAVGASVSEAEGMVW